MWKWENSDPFGANLPNENPSGLGAFAFNLRFPGQYYDQEMGTHYNYFRDYDPATGRYVQSDPIGLIAGLNTFAYVDGNPISGLDFFGLANGGGQMPSPFPILRRTYIEMKDKNVPGTDQFFHCLAACRAVKEGFTAKRVLDWMDLKENRDAALNVVGLYGRRKLSPAEMDADSEDDRRANRQGTQCPPGQTCEQQCSSLLDQLPARYQPFMKNYRSKWP